MPAGGRSDVLSGLAVSVSEAKLNQFIAIARNGAVTLYNHHPEMGQGTFQSIPMLLAKELEVDIESVTIRQAPADEGLYGRQMVVGSRSLQTEFTKLRQMGAAARQMLLQVAAHIWDMAVSQYSAKSGQVTGPGGEQIGYGELIEVAS